MIAYSFSHVRYLNRKRYPINLLVAIYEPKIREGLIDDFFNGTAFNLADDFDEGLTFVIDKLTKEERRFMLMYYKDLMSYKDIADTAHVTIEYLKFTIDKSISKLRSKGVIEFLRYGYTEAIALINSPNNTIEDLSISKRAYNCLKRNGFGDLSDFIGLTIKSFKSNDGIGDTTCNEIVNALSEFGIIVSDNIFVCN